jgi:hypothetical protein
MIWRWLGNANGGNESSEKTSSSSISLPGFALSPSLSRAR